jgi:hypothetical protein
MHQNKKSFVYIIFSLSLFLGFYLGENSSGGAKLDYEYLYPFIDNFRHTFSSALDLFAKDTGTLIHSPVFYILIGKASNLLNNLYSIKVLYLLICCFLPFLFYLNLKQKFENNHDYIYFFSLIIFFSPYFRSSSIWLLGDNLSLIFFSLSIYFINKKINSNENFLNYLLGIFFLILCCYIRYYYFLFSIYYFIIFYRNLNIKKFFILLFFAFILSIPALIYFLYIFNNYDFFNKLSKHSNLNIYSNSLIIFSIIFFYTIPFVLICRKKFIEYMKENKKMIIYFFIFFFLIFFVDYFWNVKIIFFSELGGGIFMKIANLSNISSSFLLSLISFFSLLILDFFFKGNRIENYFLLIILILSFPIFTLYQKYFDPLYFFFFFGLIKSNQIQKIFTEKIQNLKIIYSYFIFFYISSIIYYL